MMMKINWMETVPGSFGTSASFALRLGQTVLSAASLIVLCFGDGYFDFTTFSYLATVVMSMVTSWSFSFAVIDIYSILVKQLPQKASVLSLIIAGDFVLSFLSLGGACAIASVTDQLLSFGVQICDGVICSKYQVSAMLGLMSWFLLLASALFNFWVLPSLYYSQHL